LYFIASGLWLSARWMIRRMTGNRAPDVGAERQGLQRRFARYLELLNRWNVVEVTFAGFEECHRWRGSVLAPNHPSILDAVALIARVPGLDCVMSSRLLPDPVMGGAVRLCDYICNRVPVRMIRSCQRRLMAGSNVLIFPEATRTTTPPLGPFYEGFALAALKAGAPIRTILIECDSLYFGRGFSFFRPAPCPMAFRITAGRVFLPTLGGDPRALAAEIEGYFRDHLSGGTQGIFRRGA
jgi:1-acyl-sn-glycerol-3-phosphate acyltransferase